MKLKVIIEKDDTGYILDSATPGRVYTMHGFDSFPHYPQDIGYDAELLEEKRQTSLL